MAEARGGSQRENAKDKSKGSGGNTAVLDNPNPTPGSNDAAVAPSANPTTRQVTQTGEGVVDAEGERIRSQSREAADDRDAPVSLNEVITTDKRDAVSYDDTGRLVTEDGKPIALAADATDPDVGWTAQHAGAHLDEGDRVAYPGGPATVPDQTFHPDELPDPVAALRAGLLPQNVGVLNISEEKFDGKKPMEA